ncbi:MAG: hypothetical protein Q8P67_00705, partial [archaeon]|nr:hypothetical protein [archaeon]
SSSSSSSSSPSSSSSEINAVDDASAPPAEEESGAVIEPEVKPDEEQKRLTLLFTNLTEALSTVLYMDPTIGCLCRLLGALDPWTRSTVVYHRERSVTIVVALLKKYVELKSKGVMPPPDVVDDKFLHLGPVLSMLIPRCTDSSTRVRVRAVESVQTVLFIDHVLRQNAHSPPNGEAGLDLRPPEALMPMTEFRGQIAQGHLTTQFGTVFEIAGIICQLLLDDDEVANMLLKVFSALNDPELTSAAGTCVVLNAILKLRGQQLAAWLPDLVQGMVGAMGGITEEKTMNGTLHSLRTLATHHLIEVVEVLLRMPLPHTVHVVKSFQVIAQDEYLVGRMVDHFCDILNNSQVILDAGGKHNASVQSQAITAALGEVLMIEDMDCYVQAHPHQFFGTLALRLGTTSNLASGEPRKQCVVAWRELAKRLGSPGLVQLMAEPGRNRWTELGTGEYLDALRGISKAVARDHSAQLPAYYDYIAPYIKGNFFGQRVVTVAVLSEMVPFITNNSTLLHRTVNSLLTSIVEPKLMLSSIRGLGNVSHCGALEANKYAQTIINSLMASVDSADHEIAMASMAGLSSLFEVVDAPCVTPILINICHRIHPHFEGKDPEIRGTAIRLFGTLSRFGADVVSLEVLTDQIHAHLPCLLVHLNESDGLVRDHTRYTLRSMLPLLNNANLSAWVKGPFFEQGSDRPYSEVLPALATGLVQFSDRIHTYIMTLRENYWHSKRGALMCTTAVLIVGNVLAALPVESRRAVNMDIVGGALIKMFQQEKKPETRKAVAYVISLLTEY